MALIDFHCHLDLYPDPVAVVAGCGERGVYVLSVTTVPSAFPRTAMLAPSGGRVRTALGLHPEVVVTRAHELPLFESLLPTVRYVGEVGLDGTRTCRESMDRQKSVLREVLSLCRRAGGRVLTLHSRGATGTLLDMVESEPAAGTFVLHWFLGTPIQVARAAEMGCWFSVGPAMLSSQRGRAAVAAMPRDRILPESDGPFGTIDGRPAFPWDACSIERPLAALWREPAPDVEARLTGAFKSVVASPPNR